MEFLKEFIKTISSLIVTNFQSDGDYLTVNILTDREIQCDYSSCVMILFHVFTI